MKKIKLGDNMEKRIGSLGRICKRRASLLLVSMILCIFVGCFWYNSHQLTLKSQEYEKVKQDLQAQIQEQEEIAEELVQQSEYMNSDEFVEEAAREKMGLIKDNEIIFKKDQK